MIRKRVTILAVLVLACTGILCAQQNKASSAASKANAAAADDYSGMYSFLQEGEFVQINVEDEGRVTGFISRYGELDSDKGAFLDQFFKSGKLEGNKVEFVTNSVHGTYYEFSGTVERGDGKTPNDVGYYVLRGKLTKYSTDAEKKMLAQSREVTFKSFPRDLGVEPGKRD